MDRFLFVGDDLALDFINTRIRRRGRDSELLATPADLEQWRDEAARRYPELAAAAGPIDIGQLERLRAVRDMLREYMSAAAERGSFDSECISRLNDLLAQSHPQIQRTSGDGSVVIRANEPHNELAIAVALAAARLVTEGEVERLHRCEGCILLFYDRTKSATRRWCDTRCFDRERARQRRTGAA